VVLSDEQAKSCAIIITISIVQPLACSLRAVTWFIHRACSVSTERENAYRDRNGSIPFFLRVSHRATGHARRLYELILDIRVLNTE